MTVELLDCMGDDLRVVNAAKVSYHRRATAMGEAERGLLRYLLRHRHSTPFEHVVFTIRVRTSIKCAREWFRHRTDSFNEESTRYVQMRMDFYTPTPRKQVGRPGHYTYIAMPIEAAAAVVERMDRAYTAAAEAYHELLELGAAREVASYVLPLGLLTEFIVTVKLRHVLHFLSLRTAPEALPEIQQEAADVERIVELHCPDTLAAWRELGRIQLDSDRG